MALCGASAQKCKSERERKIERERKGEKAKERKRHLKVLPWRVKKKREKRGETGNVRKVSCRERNRGWKKERSQKRRRICKAK